MYIMLCKDSTTGLFLKYLDIFVNTFPSADIDTLLSEEFCRIIQRAINTGIPVKPEEVCFMEPWPPDMHLY